MNERDLHAIQPKSFAPWTSDGRADKPSKNLVRGGFLLSILLTKHFLGDFTRIPIGEGWPCLAVVIGLCSRRIVGWKIT